MTCKIISPQNESYYANLASIILPAVSGEMEVLPKHTELFTLLGQGSVVLNKAGGKTDTVDILQGVCHFKDDNAVLIL